MEYIHRDTCEYNRSQDGRGNIIKMNFELLSVTRKNLPTLGKAGTGM